MTVSPKWTDPNVFNNTGLPIDRESYQRWYDANSHFSNQHIEPSYAFLFWLLPFARGSVIDLGCQWGGVTQLLCDLPSVTNVDAIDITDYHIDRTREFVKSPKLGSITKCYIEDLGTDKQYDTVVMTGVLEHVLDAEEVLSQCLRLMKPEGNVLLMVPNKASFPEPDHIREYDDKSLHKDITEASGKTGIHVLTYFATTLNQWYEDENYSWLIAVIKRMPL